MRAGWRHRGVEPVGMPTPAGAEARGSLRTPRRAALSTARVVRFHHQDRKVKLTVECVLVHEGQDRNAPAQERPPLVVEGRGGREAPVALVDHVVPLNSIT